MWRRRRGRASAAGVTVAVLAMVACTGDDGDTGDQGATSTTAVAPAIGGAGGLLVLNGSEIPLVRATCRLESDTFDASAVSGDGLQVFAVQDNPLNPVTARIVDADLVEWFPDGVQGDEAVREGSTITSDTYDYVNDRGDFTIQAGFTINCP